MADVASLAPRLGARDGAKRRGANPQESGPSPEPQANQLRENDRKLNSDPAKSLVPDIQILTPFLRNPVTNLD
jgi:hypothetical protein